MTYFWIPDNEVKSIEDDKEDIMTGLGSALKKLAEDSFESNSQEYEF